MTLHQPVQQIAAERPEPSLGRDLLLAARYYFPRRTVLLGIAGVAIVAGAALNWSWLVATGIAPLLITLLPCAVMCGLGLCAHRLVGGSCAHDQSRATAEAKQIEASKAQLDLFESAPSASARIQERNEVQDVVSSKSRSSDRRDIHA
jgi:cell division protein FtsL